MLPMLDREGEKPGDSMFVSKYALGEVLGCERKFVFEQAEPFEWKVPIAAARLPTRRSTLGSLASNSTR